MRRQALVFYDLNWPWPGQPWPWCPFAEKSKESWGEFAAPAVPHDNHSLNGGNIWCPGHPGEIDA